MKTIFWNVDTQYDFMRNDQGHRGTLAIPGAIDIEPNLERLTKMADAAGIVVVNSADYHTMHSREISETPDFKTTFPAHCLRDTRGAEYVPATRPEDPYIIDWRDAGFDRKELREHRNIIILKDEFDVFHPTAAPHTKKVLDILRPDRVIVYGVATNVCVDYAVKGLLNFRKGTEVYVVTDAIKELPTLPLEQTLDVWRDAGARFIKTEEVGKYL
jgi:nicotinamidase/pyrazinamidase